MYTVRKRDHSRRNTRPGPERIIETEYQVVFGHKVVARYVNRFFAERDAEERNAKARLKEMHA